MCGHESHSNDNSCYESRRGSELYSQKDRDSYSPSLDSQLQYDTGLGRYEN